MKTGPFDAIRLLRIRRMRAARRLYKQAPVFALLFMQEQYPGYSQQDLLDDLRRRTKPKPRRRRNPLVRFGRYRAMECLLTQYRQTRDWKLILQADQLRRHMTDPYRVRVVLQKENLEFNFPATIAMHHIAQLTAKLKTCTEISKVLQQVEDFRVSYCQHG